MKLRALPILVGLSVGLTAGSASADEVNKRMREMFGGHANVTQPAVVQGATRGVISGGNVSLRTPIRNMPRFSFDPPTISAGCGGIDLYGGNLSFPSKEQYIQMGRAIIGNIPGAAFKMALEQTCELCASVMANIQDTVNALNFDDMSSCQIATQMSDAMRNGNNPLGGAFAGVQNTGRELAAIWKRDEGAETDIGASRNSGPGNKSPVKDALQDPQMAELLQGNLIWKGLQHSGSAAWLGESRPVREEIMSLIGTVVMCGSEVVGECPEPSGTGDPGAFPFAPILSLIDYAALDGDEGQRHQIYLCGDDDECLTPVVGERTFNRSAAQMIVDAYLGGRDGSPGLLQTSVMRASEGGTPSALEEAVLQQTGALGAMVMSCVRLGEAGGGHAEFIVRSMAPQVAAEVLHTTLSQTIRELQRYVSQRSQSVGAPRALDMLQLAQARLDAQMNDIYAKSKRVDMLATSIDRCSASVYAPGAFG